MALTNIQVKQAKAQDKPYKLADGKGMYLYVTTKSQKYWRLDYRFGGKRKTLALGVYPDISLADARAKCNDAKKQISNDLDPNDTKRIAKVTKTQSQENSFKALALEWFAQRQSPWSESHRERVDRMLHKELFPQLGRRPVGEITSPELLSCLRLIEARGVLETAKRAKQVAGQVFRYAVVTGKADRDPSVDLKDALATPIRKHFTAITEPKEVGNYYLY